jgi:hypothetical protein
MVKTRAKLDDPLFERVTTASWEITEKTGVV